MGVNPSTIKTRRGHRPNRAVTRTIESSSDARRDSILRGPNVVTHQVMGEPHDRPGAGRVHRSRRCQPRPRVGDDHSPWRLASRRVLFTTRTLHRRAALTTGRKDHEARSGRPNSDRAGYPSIGRPATSAGLLGLLPQASNQGVSQALGARILRFPAYMREWRVDGRSHLLCNTELGAQPPLA